MNSIPTMLCIVNDSSNRCLKVPHFLSGMSIRKKKMITFDQTEFENVQPIFEKYLKTLSGVNDDFWEGHILDSRIYLIRNDNCDIGITGIYNQENLTFFYISNEFIKFSQQAFSLVLEILKPKYAFTPTNDELFLSLCLDKHIKIDKQAYFFKIGNASVRSAEFGRELLTLAKPEDEKDILDKENVAENILLNKYYILRKNGVFLGQGFFNPNQFTKNSVSIGMSVHPEHRQKGAGRSIIMHLADICREKGLIPCCGCWYYNHESKLTLESAGFITKTRLLKIWFVENQS